MGGTTVTRARAVAAVSRADVTTLVHRTLTIPTARRIAALATAKTLNLTCTNRIPFGLTAERVLLADALRYGGVITTRRSVILTTFPRAVAAIRWTEQTIFAITTLPISATWLVLTNPATKLLNLADTGFVPTRFAAKRILPTNTGDYDPVVAAGRSIGLATITRVVAIPTVLGT